MKCEFDIKITLEDMYRFHLYHTYGGIHGIMSVVIAILVFCIAGKTYGSVETMYTVLYVFLGVLFLIYMPVSLYLRAKRQILTSEVFKEPLHFTVTEEKIISSQKEQSAELLWEQVYKVVETKSSILVYSSRINAFVLPKSQIGDQCEILRQIMMQKLPKYRIKLKKGFHKTTTK